MLVDYDGTGIGEIDQLFDHLGFNTLNQFFVLYVREVVTSFYIVSYYIKWVTTSWTYCMIDQSH